MQETDSVTVPYRKRYAFVVDAHGITIRDEEDKVTVGRVRTYSAARKLVSKYERERP